MLVVTITIHVTGPFVFIRAWIGYLSAGHSVTRNYLSYPSNWSIRPIALNSCTGFFIQRLANELTAEIHMFKLNRS